MTLCSCWYSCLPARARISSWAQGTHNVFCYVLTQTHTLLHPRDVALWELRAGCQVAVEVSRDPEYFRRSPCKSELSLEGQWGQSKKKNKKKRKAIYKVKRSDLSDCELSQGRGQTLPNHRAHSESREYLSCSESWAAGTESRDERSQGINADFVRGAWLPAK